MSDPATFYLCHVHHRRSGKIRHVLNYRVAYLLIDLDRLDEAGRLTSLLGIGSGGWMNFDPKDHGDGQAADLASWVRAFLNSHDVEETAASIELLTLPRMFGYVFNPVSVYFIRDEQQRLHHILYEVGNTFGERHFYLCAAGQQQEDFRHTCTKAFYVSPFFDREGHYEFRVLPPVEAVRLSIAYQAENGHGVNAVLVGTAQSVTTKTTLGLLMRFPFMTLGVIVAIHWEALKLFVKGARYHPHGPKARQAGVSYGSVPKARAR